MSQGSGQIVPLERAEKERLGCSSLGSGRSSALLYQDELSGCTETKSILRLPSSTCHHSLGLPPSLRNGDIERASCASRQGGKGNDKIGRKPNVEERDEAVRHRPNRFAVALPWTV